MDYFIDVKIKPDAEMRENVLLNKTYTKLHKALSAIQANDIGVSFPKYRLKLGDVIRLHGSEGRLVELQGMNWLGGLSGYCDVSTIQSVPQTVQCRTVSRVQTTMNLKKLAQRVAHQKESGELKSEDEVKAYEQQYKAKMFAAGLDNPYLELQSVSSGKLYRRYIQFGTLQDEPVHGEFDHFGLSKHATIPWF